MEGVSDMGKQILDISTIKQRVSDCDKTVADLCRATGINYKRLSGAVNGYWNLKPNLLRKIADVVDCWENENKSK